ncbi:MAG: NAD(P)-dependent oxidoreductase [Porticoccus sp.]|uniref:SDR family oxidoreductase n=1 Tax=Porticoccus hydrocarbonoclasticus TaxID=1073414 RepID=UPI000C42D827|nr:SDR family oxidoreductase [Porticoccus hydrocarbonoclasticus]MBG57832.1 NAD(P)-dependent oxidoreductase [Porticoccus sp.]|tara:strand:+ start:9526 stop:10410 length:885 start_codon:yes stop_codon:yes gene_type:complete
MTIAITAASGHLGSEIIKATAALVGNDQVIGVARNPEHVRALDVELRRGDYNNRHEFEQALAGVDTLLLVSGMDAPDKRIAQHRNVIAAAQAQNVKKIVYTSIQGAEKDNAFSPIVQSNRQTEQDIQASGLDWIIGRNGIYIEPDVEYIETYKEKGEIANCAADGKCGYTTRPELACAYARLLTDTALNGNTCNLHGEPITQTQLANYLNGAFGTQLGYRSMSVAEYRQERIEELGEFMGNIIAGIYEGIRNGYADNPSDFALAAGRAHQSWQDYFSGLGLSLGHAAESTGRKK